LCFSDVVVETFENVPLVGRGNDFFVLLVEDIDILEEHVQSLEVGAEDLAVEGESHRLVVGMLAVEPHTAVTEGLVVIRNEVPLVLFDVRSQHDEQGESLSSLLAFRQQQVLWEAAVSVTLETEPNSL
jgi:hypothetical protein